MGNIIVGQSGGPTSAINASLYGVIKKGYESGQFEHVYGMINGIEGLINDTIMDLESTYKDSNFDFLKTTPSSYLGSCRFKLPEDLDDKIYQVIFSQFNKYNIVGFYYIGGNDSMDTVSKLSKYATKNNIEGITFIGVPKTVDNDLVNTDHTPGFGSAAKYVATSVREISMDASVYSTIKSLTIVEIMGRHAGWLTAASALARNNKIKNPYYIYLPEVDFDVEKFIADIQNALNQVNNIIVCISEGIHDKDGKFITEYIASSNVDNFGHKYLDGTASVLEQLVKEKLGIKTRSIALSIPQRASSRNLSLTDIDESIKAGIKAVEFGLENKNAVMVAFDRTNEYEISFVAVDVNEICNKEKKVPREWINDEGNDVSNEVVNYIKPLIQGCVEIVEEDGLPKFLYR